MSGLRSRFHARFGLVALLSLGGIVLAGLIASGVAAQGPQPQAAQAVTGPGFTYQGQIKKDGLPYNGQCDFQFALYDASSGGTRIGITQTLGTANVANGVFSTILNGNAAAYGQNPFDGGERWLDIQARCPSNVGAYTPLVGRQPLTAVPYAFALPGLWVQRNATSPNIIGGFSGNTIVTTSNGSVIGGGGGSGLSINQIDGNHSVIAGGSRNSVVSSNDSFIGGGFSNTVTGHEDMIGGGGNNLAFGDHSVIGGGINNQVGDDSVVAGGYGNVADGFYGTVAGGRFNHSGSDSSFIGGGDHNRATDDDTTVTGGISNTASSAQAFVGGGGYNTASGSSAIVGGGQGNVASGPWATVSGGLSNTAALTQSVVGGGRLNVASNLGATIAGGRQNSASGLGATIGGGALNTATGTDSTIGGGQFNTTSGDHATVPGGSLNTAGGQYSLAAGNQAQALQNGTFVWADSTNATFNSTGVDQFLIRANGGVGIATNAPQTQLHVVKSANGSGTNPADNVVLFENTNTNNSADVLALKIGGTASPATSNNFITFLLGNNTSAGSIEGNNIGGIQLGGPGADYAEWLPRLDLSESMQPGDIVGIVGGRVTKDTREASQVMVVSTGPIVSGNDPGEAARGGYAQVAFIGQALVKVRGPVQAGDFIVPSGLNDGAGIGVAPESVTAEQLAQVVGEAWEAVSGAELKSVRVAVGFIRNDVALRRVMERNDAQAKQLAALDGRVDALERSANGPLPWWLVVGSLVAAGLWLTKRIEWK